MNEVIAAAKLGWTALAKLPRLFGWLIRRSFPEGKCREDLRLSMPGTHARFELLKIRPTPALCGLSVEIHNTLPFPVCLELTSASIVLEGAGIGEATLNRHVLVPAAGFASVSLPEWALGDHTANWVRSQGLQCAGLRITLDWRCASDFRHWSSSKSFEVTARINMDRPNPRGE